MGSSLIFEHHFTLLEMDFATSVISYMKAQGMTILCRNQVFIEDCDENGNPVPNDFRADRWNDRALIIDYDGKTGKATMAHNAAATCEPGVFYTTNRMNPEGAFRIKFGQYTAWEIGRHHKIDPALVQCRSLPGYRDDNEDGSRIGDCEVCGDYGIDVHHGYNSDEIGPQSAGCLVRKFIAAHNKAMQLIQEYPPSDGIYTVTILPGDKVFALANEQVVAVPQEPIEKI
jgi:hypothetical protein